MRPVQKKGPKQMKPRKMFWCGSTEHFKCDCPKTKKSKGQVHKKEKQKQSAKNKLNASAWSAEIDEEALLKIAELSVVKQHT